MKAIGTDIYRQMAIDDANPEVTSILGSKVDLKGDEKQYHQMTLDEFMKKISRTHGKAAAEGARSTFEKGYVDSIKNAINKKWYQEDISKGRMTAQDAKTIIEKAGLEV